MEAVLSAAAKTAAVHLLRYASTASSSAWRVNQSSVRAKLLGHVSAASKPAAAQDRFMVLAVVPGSENQEGDTVLREQLASLVGLVVAGWANGGCTVIDSVVYALLPLGIKQEADARAVAETILQQSRESFNQRVAVGLSSTTKAPPAGRLESLETARWIAANGGGSGSFEEIRLQATLARVRSPGCQRHLSAFDRRPGSIRPSQCHRLRTDAAGLLGKRPECGLRCGHAPAAPQLVALPVAAYIGTL